MNPKREELLKHLAASLKDAKEDGGAILLVGAGISVSAGIPPTQKLMQIAIENFPNYFTEEEKQLLKKEPSKLQYNDIMTKLSAYQRKTLFNWHIKGDEKNNIPKAKLNFAHLAIAELLKQGYIKRILTTNFDPLLINACYMVGMYPLPSIYDLGSVNQINPELFDDPCIIYLNGQHAGQVQRNTPSQLVQHKFILNKVIHSTGCKRPWIIAGYSGENDPLMDALNELRPFNNWLYWLEYSDQVLEKESHHFLRSDEECKVIYQADADETFMEIAELLQCSLDFIERPEVELQNYLDEINFQYPQHFEKLYHKACSFQKSIQNYKDFFQKLSATNIEDILSTEIFVDKILEEYREDIDTKISMLKKLHEIDPNNTKTTYLIAHFLDIKGQKIPQTSIIKESIFYFQKYFNLNPQGGIIYYSLAKIYIRLSKLENNPIDWENIKFLLENAQQTTKDKLNFDDFLILLARTYKKLNEKTKQNEIQQQIKDKKSRNLFF